MKGEQFRPPEMEDWQREIIEDVERIKRIPESILKPGPVYEVQTKTGELLTCETYELNLEEAKAADIQEVKNPHVGHERLYLIAKDAEGRIVGTRFTSLFNSKLFNQIRASSVIRVIKKGQGYAAPIEEAFQRQLQDFADKSGESIVWDITNYNLEQLEEYRAGTHVDETVLREKEKEQERWQALYGEGGKLGIVNRRKKFVPKSTE